MNTATRRLEDKVAIITGGASGQGAREARRFVAEGAKVVFTDLNTAAGQALAAELGANAVFVKHDVTQEKEWEAVVKATVAKFGKLNVLVNNAGVYKPGPLIDTTQENFELHYRVNMLSCFLGMKHAIAPMQNAGGGSIVNISSISGYRPSPRSPAYAAVKAALFNYTTTQAAVLAAKGIRVNCVAPGSIEFPGGTLEKRKSDNPKLYNRILESIPFGRLGHPEEVANVVLFLASPRANWVTGQTITVDGGQLLRS